MSVWFHGRVILACVVSVLVATEALSQPLGISLNQNAEENPAPTTAPPKPPSLQERREKIAEQLQAAQRALEAAQAELPEGKTAPRSLLREVDLYKQLEVVVAQNLAAVSRAADMRTELIDLKNQLESVEQSGPSEEKPYSFLLLDHQRDELASLEQRSATVDATVENAALAESQAKTVLETRNQERFEAKTALDAATDDAKIGELKSALKFAKINVQIAEETLSLRKQELANEVLDKKIHLAEIALLQEKTRWMEQGVVFSEEDLRTQMLELDKQEADIQREIRFAEAELSQADRAWSRARTQLDDATGSNPVLVELVEEKLLARQGRQQRVVVLNARLQRNGKDRELWNRRYRVITDGANAEELITWTSETQALLEQLTREEVIGELRIDELRQNTVNREKKLQSIDESNAEIRRHVAAQSEELSQLTQVYNANIVSIRSTESLAKKLLAEIEGDVATWSWSQWGESARYYFDKVRNMVLAKVDGHPITVGALVAGLILLLIGFFLARLLSRWLGARLRTGRVQMHDSAASALQSISFYVLLVCFTFTALRFVNVPLTVFTFLGGAIAIGVGFGSQNIINNFISGLILLAERPIKVGDLIQLDDLYGSVIAIGARSTVVRTGQNLELVVPNSKFLENNVVNLTRGDDRLRTVVKVGVAYGSPTREVVRLLKHAADEHGRVLSQPEPFVLFVDFADNSLNFEVHFWIKMRTITERLRVESDIRFRIDTLFREAHISIAFPQRDVHLNTTAPMAVRIITAPAEEEAGTPRS